ncbi:MAG: alkaline phosphatase family protein [Myxococcaceae bacterium]|nr:alkaline phosphatase family protein [Myxococcaceae bacterium]
MHRRWPYWVLLLAVVAQAKPPRLTLFISVDALGTDVFQRNRPKLKGGFYNLTVNGAFFPNARHGIAECATAAGHTSLVTGTFPWRHGIVSNRVLNRATGKLESAFADPSHPVLDAPLSNEDVSPVNLLTETLADRVRLSTYQKGKAIAIAGKARAAVAMGGHLGEAWWFHEQVGRFVTGTYYRKEAPTWVKGFNDKKLPDTYQSKEWALLLPPAQYWGEDDRPFESDWHAMGRKFPHPLSGGLSAPGVQSYQALSSSPMMNDVMVQFAKAAIDGEALGKDDVTDFLAVSFSANDKVYHLYGPYSWEMQDALLRLDRSIAELIAHAEKAAGGRGNLLVVLSADHGGAAVPEEWAKLGLDGVRVPPSTLEKGLEKELATKFNGGDMVQVIEETDVYLDHKAIADKKLDVAAVRRAAAAWLNQQPGMLYAVSRDDLFTAAIPQGYGPAVQRGFHPDRSGDVLMLTKPFNVIEAETAGTSHGTPYSYDAEVPVIFYGKGIRPGYYPQNISIADVATTVSALLEMGQPASAEGDVRSEALLMNAR